MTVKRAFKNPEGEEKAVVVEKALMISGADVAFASLPAGVQAAAAALSGNDDWRMGSYIIASGAIEDYWFSLGAGSLTIT